MLRKVTSGRKHTNKSDTLYIVYTGHRHV